MMFKDTLASSVSLFFPFFFVLARIEISKSSSTENCCKVCGTLGWVRVAYCFGVKLWYCGVIGGISLCKITGLRVSVKDFS